MSCKTLIKIKKSFIYIFYMFVYMTNSRHINLVIFFVTNFNGRWVVTGQTESSLLKISIAFFFTWKCSEIYSVIPKNFLFKNLVLFIGPLMNLWVSPDSRNLNATLKHFFK